MSQQTSKNYRELLAGTVVRQARPSPATLQPTCMSLWGPTAPLMFQFPAEASGRQQKMAQVVQLHLPLTEREMQGGLCPAPDDENT